jgi:hypothetical protein
MSTVRRILVVAVVLFCSVTQAQAAVVVRSLQVEYRSTPLGIDVQQPRFSWQMEATAGERGVSQTAYRIEVRDSKGAVVWDSKKTNGSEAVHVTYGGSALKASTRYTWTVTVWTLAGAPLTASSWFETGLMDPSPLSPAWGGATWMGGGHDDLVLSSPYLAVFDVTYVLAIAPGSARASFVYGANDSRLMDRNKNIYQLQNAKDQSYIKLELDISALGGLPDGKAKLLVYRAGYKDTDSPSQPLKTFDVDGAVINHANRHAKHTIEFRSAFGRITLTIDGTTFSGMDGGGRGAPGTPFTFDTLSLVGQIGNSAGVFRTRTAKSVKEVRPKVYVYDMGQNLVGVPRITIANGRPGGTIAPRYSEMLYPDLPASGKNVGMIMTENDRAALSQDVYAMKAEPQTFQPRFTSHGYQYIDITGIDQPLLLSAVEGIAISSIRSLTADYKTSSEKVNRRWSNLVWSNVDNVLTIPTDCPQRNERMGWSGDISVFSRTATYVSNANQFLTRHMYAMRDVQTPAGKFTDVASVDGGITPSGKLSNPYPNGLSQPVGSSLGLATLVGNGYTYQNQGRTIPYVHQFSVGVQRELAWQVVLDASYVGSRTRGYPVAKGINEITAGQLATGTAMLVQVPHPFAGLLPGTAMNGATVPLQQLVRPYPQFTGITEDRRPIGEIDDNSLQMTFNKRLSKGLQFLVSDTYSKRQQRTEYLNAQNGWDEALQDMTSTPLAIIDGPWAVAFQAGRGAPGTAAFPGLTSWSEHADRAVRYFSGTATYAKSVDAPAGWFASGAQLWLDLGDVKNMTEVTVNGRKLPLVWKQPFRVNVTGALRPGANAAEIAVTNLWVNRIVGDLQPDAIRQYTFTPMAFYTAGSPLLPSGLLGPVRVIRMSTP